MMPFEYVKWMTEMLAPQPYPPQPNLPLPPITPLRRPVRESTIGLFTSAGVRRRDDPPLAETNDLSYRIIERDVPLSDLVLDHRTPVRVWAQEDLSVAFPRDRLVELEAEGTIGRLAPRALSMVGSITRFTELTDETVPRIKEEFEAQGVDLVFLFPF
jgi:D-proline reductase (dithiol) PrdB